MTVDESKKLKKGTRVYWRGDAADSGIVTENKLGCGHKDMREIQRVPTRPPPVIREV